MINLDKTYVLWVIEKLNITPYKLAKKVGISTATTTRITNFQTTLSWNTIYKIETITDLKFRDSEHIMFHKDFMDTHPELFDELD